MINVAALAFVPYVVIATPFIVAFFVVLPLIGGNKKETIGTTRDIPTVGAANKVEAYVKWKENN